MSTSESPQCVIVSGMPGAGQSTVTALAARLLPRAAQVKGDEVNQMIVSGQVWFLGTLATRRGDSTNWASATCARSPTISSTTDSLC